MNNNSINQIIKDIYTDGICGIDVPTITFKPSGATIAKIDNFDIKEVIFNDPATIILWADGTKTVVKCDGEDYDPEKGMAMAISKKALGNKGNYYNTFKKWLPDRVPCSLEDATPIFNLDGETYM